MNLAMALSISTNQLCGIFISIASNQQIALERADILRISGNPIREQTVSPSVP